MDMQTAIGVGHNSAATNDPGVTTKMTARDVSVFYGAKQALKNVSIDISRENVTAFIGPSGCGKSTFLRCFNRMNDLIPGARMAGEIRFDGEDIAGPGTDAGIAGRSSMLTKPLPRLVSAVSNWLALPGSWKEPPPPAAASSESVAPPPVPWSSRSGYVTLNKARSQ